MSSIFSGLTMQCVGHYGSTLEKGKTQVVKARKPLADFLGSKTLPYSILAKGQEPIGLNLLKLRFFLFHQGYGVSELKELTKELFELGNLLALDIISVQEAADKLSVNRDTILAWTIRNQGISEKSRELVRDLVSQIKQEKILEIAEKLDDLASVKIANSNGNSASVMVSSPSMPTVKTELPESQPSPSSKPVKDLSLAALAAVIDAFIPLAQHVLINATPEERQVLRDILVKNPEGVFQASNLMSGLCSEHARKTVLTSKGRKI